MQGSVVYLGHRVDGEGLHTTDHKVKAVKRHNLETSVS